MAQAQQVSTTNPARTSAHDPVFSKIDALMFSLSALEATLDALAAAETSKVKAAIDRAHKNESRDQIAYDGALRAMLRATPATKQGFVAVQDVVMRVKQVREHVSAEASFAWLYMQFVSRAMAAVLHDAPTKRFVAPPAPWEASLR